MSGYSPDGAIVQVHGVGPFHIHWKDGLRTLDAPDWDKTFRFTKGVDVIAGDRRGRILQGYASGAIAQYEFEDAASAMPSMSPLNTGAWNGATLYQ
jgi:hypothetical protein